MTEPQNPAPLDAPDSPPALTPGRRVLAELPQTFNQPVLGNLLGNMLGRVTIQGSEVDALADLLGFAGHLVQGRIVLLTDEQMETFKQELNRLDAMSQRVEELNALMSEPEIKKLLDRRQASDLRDQAAALLVRAGELDPPAKKAPLVYMDEVNADTNSA